MGGTVIILIAFSISVIGIGVNLISILRMIEKNHR